MDKKDIAKSKHIVYVIAERCKGCGYCIEFCPQKALSKSDEINSHGYHLVRLKDNDKCTGCNMCDMVCPEFAISVMHIKQEAESRR